MNITVTEFANASLCLNHEGSRLEMQNRKSCAVIMTESGHIRFSQNGKDIISSAVSPVFIPQGAYYINTCLEDAKSMMINFYADTDITEIRQLPCTNFASVKPYFEMLKILSLKSVASKLSFAEKCRAKADLYSVLGILFENSASTCDTELIFRNASEYIAASIGNKDLDCQSLASQFNISEVYLRRIFLKYSGLPTWKYIKKLRLEEARKLLSEKMSVKSTADITGFSDIYSFSRAYSDYFGFPPSKT